MNKTIEVKKNGFLITLVLDKVLYVQLPDVEPSMRSTETLATVYLHDASFNLTYAEAKKVKDALKGFN